MDVEIGWFLALLPEQFEGLVHVVVGILDTCTEHDIDPCIENIADLLWQMQEKLRTDVRWHERN